MPNYRAIENRRKNWKKRKRKKKTNKMTVIYHVLHRPGSMWVHSTVNAEVWNSLRWHWFKAFGWWAASFQTISHTVISMWRARYDNVTDSRMCPLWWWCSIVFHIPFFSVPSEKYPIETHVCKVWHRATQTSYLHFLLDQFFLLHYLTSLDHIWRLFADIVSNILLVSFPYSPSTYMPLSVYCPTIRSEFLTFLLEIRWIPKLKQ